MGKKNNNLILALYTISFIAYVYFKLSFSINYMFIFKSLMYGFLAIFYFKNISKINYKYMLFFVIIMISDLYGILAENISIPIFLFFISNLTLAYLICSVAKRTCKAFNPNKYLIIITIILILIYSVFVLFNKTLLDVTALGLSLVWLLYVSFNYYSKYVRSSSFLFLAGVALLIITYAFTGLNQLVIPYKYFSLIDGLAFALALLIICKATLTAEREYIEGIEIIN